MIKLLKKYQIRSSPFNAAKDWSLSNTNNQDLWLMEDTGSEVPVALEFLDYGDGSESPILNSSCDIALEQQTDDTTTIREGLKVEGPFYPDSDPQNKDETYKRSIFSQVRTMFYNQYRNPTKMWGLENIDFELSETKRLLTDRFRLISVPKTNYGDKIIPSSVAIIDENLDNLYVITDDGNGNLFAQRYLFTKFQIVGQYTNSFVVGSSSYCDDYFNYIKPITASFTESLVGGVGGAGILFGFLTGSLDLHPTTESSPPFAVMEFSGGVLDTLPPLVESGSIDQFSFLYGSLVSEPPHSEFAAASMSFSGGLLFETITTASATESVTPPYGAYGMLAFSGGLLFDTMLPSTGSATASTWTEFSGGLLFDTTFPQSGSMTASTMMEFSGGLLLTTTFDSIDKASGSVIFAFSGGALVG